MNLPVDKCVITQKNLVQAEVALKFLEGECNSPRSTALKLGVSDNHFNKSFVSVTN